jgi:scyllo-inositol 2-dehydrogenase (NADP+)
MIGVGIIGFGLMGKRYVENINKNKKFRVIKILRKKKNKDKIFTTQHKFFFEDQNIELYIVASSLNTHFNFIKKILLKKKNIVVEKPFVSNNLQANKIKKIYKLKKIQKFIVHYNDLYNLNSLNLRKKLKKVGKIKKIDLVYGKLQSGKIEELIKDWLSHPLSVLIYFFGMPLATKIINKEHKQISVLVQYKNFNAVIKYSNQFKKRKKIIKFIGTKSNYSYDGYNKKLNSINSVLNQYLLQKKIDDVNLSILVTKIITKISKALGEKLL